MAVDGYGLQVLDHDRCVALMQTATLGRVAMTIGAMPIILPVSFSLLNGEPVFPVASVSIARAADRDEVVCFETDWVDPAGGAAWSVAVVGQLSMLTEPSDVEAARRLDFHVWGAPPDRFARVRSGLISGRSRHIEF